MASRPPPQRHKRSVLPKGSPTSSAASFSRHAVEPTAAPAEGQCSPSSTSARSLALQQAACFEEGAVENVTVTVRFRPLSQREIRQGEEIAWYADGDTIVRSEHNPSVAYAYDRVFGPTTTTRHVYDVAAQHVVSGAMEGINGTIFAYGVTSSGKTHTMHGDQRSPGIIPLAVKDAFSIIQETPSREFLLRVSYLEIYNEVVNDLLNPAGQNLRIREDSQGTFVEGIKEEVVLSPAHALSLIAAGEEHRHIGSNNFNVLSSRSHTIFTLTIESSPSGDYCEAEAVNFSQLNLIDLAGSESSRSETTGIRRKEGSYINKSLLTLGTVISKLTEGKATHIPYRDSKLTRLLQSSLSGQGHVSLICTVTPSLSISEETHNTLKFAHRAKRIEIQASQNKILDERSLIKKYQNEIRRLKEELEQLKKGIITAGPLKDMGEEDLVLLKQKLEDGHVKLQSRLEQEEEAKAALLSRIQRLTKLILVSTKAAQSSRFPQRPGPRRRHSFGEEELAYLPYRRREVMLDDENVEFMAPIEGYGESIDDSSKQEKKNRNHGLLNWFKLRKKDNGVALASKNDKSSITKSQTASSTPKAGSTNCLMGPRNPSSINTEGPADLFDLEQARDAQNDNSSGQDCASANMRSVDHIDLLKEQVKILSGEVALSSSILKRLSEEASHSPKRDHIEMEMRKINEEIKVKNQQILSLEKQIADANLVPQNKNKLSKMAMSPSYADILEQLNEKTFDLEVKTADNRVIQDQLLQKISECEMLEETLSSLKEQLAEALKQSCPDKEKLPQRDAGSELMLQEQALEIEELRQKVMELTNFNNQLEVTNRKLAEEASYAKGLASAAGIELKALSEEVAKLMNYNERLAAELATLRNTNQRRPNGALRNKRDIRRHDQPMKQETNSNHERKQALESALMEMEQREDDLRKTLEESKQREANLENELASMWVLVAKLKKSCSNEDGESVTTGI